MTELDNHADALIGYHARLLAGGLDPAAAGACTVEMSKALLAGALATPEPTVDEQREALATAAAEKAARRAAQLAGGGS